MRLAAVLGIVLCGAPAWPHELAGRLAVAVANEQIVAAHAANVIDLLKKADRYGQPFSAQFSALFPLFGPRVFRSSQMRALDLAWPVHFYLVASKDSPVRFAYTAGAIDPAAFLGGLGTPGLTRDGVTSYLAPGGITFYGAALGPEVLVSDRRDLALAALQAPASAPEPGPEGDLELDIAVARLLALDAEKIESSKSEFFQRLESLHSQPGISPKEMRTFYELDFLLAETLGRQIGRLGLSVELDGPDGVLRARVEPLPGSALGRFVAAQTGLSDVSLVHVPNDAVLALGLSFVSTPDLVDGLVAMLDPAGELGPRQQPEAPSAGPDDLPPGTEPTPPPRVGAELRRRYQEFYGGLGPELSILLLPPLEGKAGLRTVTVAGYREPEQFVPRLQGLVAEVLPFLVSFYRELGWTFDMWLTRSLPTQMPEGTWQIEMRFAGLSDTQRAIFEALYGGPEMRAFVRPVGGRVLAVTGPDSTELMRDWSGRLSAAPVRAPAGGQPPGGLRLALGFVDVPAYLKLGVGLLSRPGAGGAGQALEAALGERQQLFVEARTDGKSVRLELRYPLEAALRAYKAAKP
jgi:hypothetical protein